MSLAWIPGPQDVLMTDSAIILTRGQLSEWAGLGRNLTDEEIMRLADCIPHSSIPDAIGTIITEAMGLSEKEEKNELDERAGRCAS